MTIGPWCALAALASLAAAGCGTAPEKRAIEYTTDMEYSVAYDAFSPNPVTRDGLTLQRPVPGTIARGHLPLHYRGTRDDAERAGRELQSPVAWIDDREAAEGRALFETFCAHCHGKEGNGDGPLVPKIPNPPAYTSARVREMPPGQIFHVITFGSGRMPAHASQIAPRERWLIAAHVRTLQQRGGGK